MAMNSTPDAELDAWVAGVLAPTVTSENGFSYGLVSQAIEFAAPPRTPCSFLPPYPSDIFELAAVAWQRRYLEQRQQRTNPCLKEHQYLDVWGVAHEPAQGLFDHVIANPLNDLGRISGYKLPSFENQIADLLPLADRAFCLGKYVVAADPVCLYERARDLMGFEALLTAPISQSQGLRHLLNLLTEVTLEVIETYGRSGRVHAFMTWQDFATQTGMVMRMETFREYYRPCFARLIDACHAQGMHFIWHCCGQNLDLIQEMIALGVNVVQLDQPRLLGHQLLADRFGGRICFWNSVDTQWCVSEPRTAQQLREEVVAMREPFARFKGGFIARHYPQPWDIGLDSDFHRITREAFLEPLIASNKPVDEKR
jgi:hypothetical protein